MLNLIKDMMDWIARNVLKVFFLCFLVVAIVVKGMYSFWDMPYFELSTIYDIVILIVVCILYGIIYKKRNWIQENIRYIWGFFFFMLLAVLFIYLVPLKPFSDMEHVYQAAIQFANMQWDGILNDVYWNAFPGNMRLGIFWGILLLPFPKTLVTIKVINALFAYGSIFLISKLCEAYGLKYSKVIYMILLCFLPIILYINHVYFDLPFLFFCVLALYLNKRYNNIILVGIILGIAAYLRKNAQIFLIAIVLDYVFKKMKKKEIRNNILNIVKVLITIILCIGISKCMKGIVDETFLTAEHKSYPGWNQIYIGLNEEKLGMMDGDFSYDRDAGDIVARIQEYGSLKTVKILAMKTFWLWTQGTYQAQRYGFGLDVENELDKFEYETIITKRLLNDEQKVRKVVNALMRTQYMIMFALMTYTLWRKKDISDMRILYYIIIATFLIMIVYELKSRYIFHCFPGMAVMSCWALENIEQREWKCRKKGEIKKER